jgi:hypothetical protein
LELLGLKQGDEQVDEHGDRNRSANDVERGHWRFLDRAFLKPLAQTNESEGKDEQPDGEREINEIHDG